MRRLWFWPFPPLCANMTSSTSLKPRSKFHQIFCRPTCLSVAMDRSSSDYSAIRRVCQCFHIMGPMGQNQARRYVSSSLPDGGTGGEVWCLRLLCCCCCPVAVAAAVTEGVMRRPLPTSSDTSVHILTAPLKAEIRVMSKKWMPSVSCQNRRNVGL